MATVQHADIPEQHNHGIVWKTVPNEAARLALVITAEDVAAKRVIRQTSDDTLWVATSTVPAFQPLGAGGGVQIAKDNSPMTVRAKFNIIGAEELLIDNPGNNSTDLDIGALMGRGKASGLTIGSSAINNYSITANFQTDPIKVAGNAWSATLNFSGSFSGTFDVEISNDPTPTLWSSLGTIAQILVSGGSPAIWNVTDAGYMWARIKYTHTSGTGTLATGTYTAKGGN